MGLAKSKETFVPQPFEPKTFKKKEYERPYRTEKKYYIEFFQNGHIIQSFLEDKVEKVTSSKRYFDNFDYLITLKGQLYKTKIDDAKMKHKCVTKRVYLYTPEQEMPLRAEHDRLEQIRLLAFQEEEKKRREEHNQNEQRRWEAFQLLHGKKNDEPPPEYQDIDHIKATAPLLET